MIDQRNDFATLFGWSYTGPGDGDTEPLLTQNTFTRSDGTIIARLYERLTKASRRRNKRDGGARWMITWSMGESMYRQGVYDAYKALQEELEQ